MQRGLIHAVVDAADSVIIDDAGSPLVPSMSAHGATPDPDVHLAAMHVSNAMIEDTHFTYDKSTGMLTLTNARLNRCHDDNIAIPTSVLLRPWTASMLSRLYERSTSFGAMYTTLWLKMKSALLMRQQDAFSKTGVAGWAASGHRSTSKD